MSSHGLNCEDLQAEQRLPFQVCWFSHYFPSWTRDVSYQRVLGLKRPTWRVLQIFPEPVEVVLSPDATLNSVEPGHQKERLPSIVVEPTELSEVESGELRWPPENMDTEDDEEDLFLEQCIPPANIADWGDDEEEEEVGEGTPVLLTPQPGLTLIGRLDENRRVS